MRIWSLLLFAFPLLGIANEPILPLEPTTGLNADKVSLGRALFFDKRLSRGDQVSCASCHQLPSHGADVKPLSRGVNNALGELKTPTVYNAALNIRQAWDGRAQSLYDQVDSPILNPKEHDMTWPEVVAKLNQDKVLVAQFAKVYSRGITPHTVKDAIATFEESLITLNAPFDLWLKDSSVKLPESVIAGYELFKRYGCISCHQGRNVGGNMFARMGTFGDYFGDRNTPIKKADFGRFNVTGNEQDRFVFKVPSLRLASKQAYFFHDGSHTSLESAIEAMARYQLGRKIPDTDMQKLVAFINSLAGHHHEMDLERQNEE
ncbi:cytochrome-c peroxidase [Pseudoalteromonas sp. McH1-7]|uniref:cytochrome-c peroxidase n=1 Tax=Pseudoalteromonas sp. McH1-7 TaxID=2745574 RepID=UPI001591E6BE|nr:cytochrome c peroxidase [Pseudoalteromonas sp. McH1-7]NUZ10899.1 cytochrome-c peroxidase [Pseudoalteromonas sp. McH1-7]